MTYKLLPPVVSDMKVPLPHFPDAFHAVVFRLWETVAAERIADALEVSRSEVRQAAAKMGLPAQRHTELWTERGYITTIRNVWHLLPYGQLLRVLGWSEDRLAAVLKEDDFLDVKLGPKPDCAPVRPVSLTDEGRKRLSAIKARMEGSFGDWFEGKRPFAFFADEPVASPFITDDTGLKMIYSYCGLYADVLDRDIEISYPDAILRQYAAAGINAVWLHTVLYQLVPFPFDESYSEGWEQRQARLRTLIEKAGRYGIKVYLYLNEPRCMPLSFFEKHPDLMGSVEGAYAALCTSLPAVRDYLRYAVRTLCENVRGLGGFFVITCSENLTHCKSRKKITPCPRCADVSVPVLVSDVLCAISEESRCVDPSIRTIAWTWAWDAFMTEAEMRDCIDRLPREVVIMSGSEIKKEFEIGGVKGRVQDYSMSIPGPSRLARSVWEYAKAKGHEVCAKVQVNNTWECSTVPYLPVFDLIREHMIGLRDCGVRHLVFSWTLGGYPSVNLKIAADCLDDPSDERYKALLEREYGAYAPAVAKATALFSEAFRAFPFHIATLYHGPQNAGPSNLLYAKATGLRSTMTCYAFDDLDGWRSIYPASVFVEQLRLLSEGWQKGLEALAALPEDSELWQMAQMAYTIFRSSYLQARFITERDRGANTVATVEEERELALIAYRLMNRNPAIGYEAANHYYYNKGMMIEKVLNCDFIRGNTL